MHHERIDALRARAEHLADLLREIARDLDNGGQGPDERLTAALADWSDAFTGLCVDLGVPPEVSDLNGLEELARRAARRYEEVACAARFVIQMPGYEDAELAVRGRVEQAL